MPGRLTGKPCGIEFKSFITDTIQRIVSVCPGEMGVALIVNGGDTVTVNNRPVYPMMSVFKVHQAIALCRHFECMGWDVDSLLVIGRDELDSDTWSPMLRDCSGPVFELSVRDLLNYTLTQSDNNASNIMFERFVGTEETDRIIAEIIPRSCFKITFSETDMRLDHSRIYSNCTSPLGGALLFNKLFTDSLMGVTNQNMIKEMLGNTATGQDRIVAPLLNAAGVTAAHKTGSGYINEKGLLTAHNDIAYVTLPNGLCYTLAIFVKDFNGTESQASGFISRLSSVVYDALVNLHSVCLKY